jgi:hypothetical protein
MKTQLFTDIKNPERICKQTVQRVPALRICNSFEIRDCKMSKKDVWAFRETWTTD